MKKFMAVIFATLVMFILSADENDYGCLKISLGLLCYDGFSHPALLSFATSYNTRKYHEYTDVTARACNDAAAKSLVLNYVDESGSRSFPILLSKPVACYSTGNMLGTYYEALSFGIAKNIIVGRLNGDCDGFPNNSTIFVHLPRLYIPNQPSTSLTTDVCTAIKSNSPWDNRESVFWNHLSVIRQIHKEMIFNYLVANMLQTDQALAEESLTIHYRCRDNVVEKMYGLLPFSIYKQLLSTIAKNSHHTKSNNVIRKIIIVSDAKQSEAYGTLCWSLVGSLRDKILSLPMFEHTRVDLVYTPPSMTFALMHVSKALICSVSTFCFFAGLGGKEVYFLKSEQLIQAPDTFWTNSNYHAFTGTTIAKDSKTDWKTFAKMIMST